MLPINRSHAKDLSPPYLDGSKEDSQRLFDRYQSKYKNCSSKDLSLSAWYAAMAIERFDRKQEQATV